MSDSNLAKKNEILNEGNTGDVMPSSGSDLSKNEKEKTVKNNRDETMENIDPSGNAEIVETSESGSASDDKAIDETNDVAFGKSENEETKEKPAVSEVSNESEEAGMEVDSPKNSEESGYNENEETATDVISGKTLEKVEEAGGSDKAQKSREIDINNPLDRAIYGIKSKASEAAADPDSETLAQIEARIDAQIGRLYRTKVEILKDLCKIYRFRSDFFADRPEYVNNFALYIKKRFAQSGSTYSADARVVKMLFELKKIEMLDKPIDDLVHLLRMIARAENPKPLLERVDEFDRDKLEEELERLKEKNPKDYTLKLTEVSDTRQIHEKKRANLVIVAKVKDSLHFRISDKVKNITLDKAEKDFPEKAQEIQSLKTELEDCWGQEAIIRETRHDIVGRVLSITKRLPAFIKIGELTLEDHDEGNKILVSFKDPKQSENIKSLKKHLKKLEDKKMRRVKK